MRERVRTKANVSEKQVPDGGKALIRTDSVSRLMHTDDPLALGDFPDTLNFCHLPPHCTYSWLNGFLCLTTPREEPGA